MLMLSLKHPDIDMGRCCSTPPLLASPGNNVILPVSMLGPRSMAQRDSGSHEANKMTKRWIAKDVNRDPSKSSAIRTA